jgi:predicted CXXCH cytochrome family protein
MLDVEPGALCRKCHQQDPAELTKAGQHPPYVNGECARCHVSHHSPRAGLLVDDLTAACVECHTEQKEQLAAAVKHPPFTDGDCAGCHVPHIGDTPALLVDRPEGLCTECHADVAGQFAASKHNTAIPKDHPSGACQTCHTPHAGNQRALLLQPAQTLCAECHNIASHGAHPAGPPAQDVWHGRVMTCDSCHSPHGTGNPYSLWLTGDALCLQCHPDMSGPPGSAQE